jgi:hypothetical protein
MRADRLEKHRRPALKKTSLGLVCEGDYPNNWRLPYRECLIESFKTTKAYG